MFLPVYFDFVTKIVSCDSTMEGCVM